MIVNETPENTRVRERVTEAAGGALGRALVVGDTAPEFALQDTDHLLARLEDLLKGGPLALLFYRGLWCPHCNVEIAAVQGALRTLERAGATVVGLTPQTRASQRRAARETPIAYRLLTDEGNAVADRFGLRFELPEDVRQAYRDYGVDLPAYNGEDSWSLPLSARYVIGRDRVIRYAEVSADHTVRPDPLDMLPAIAAAR